MKYIKSEEFALPINDDLDESVYLNDEYLDGCYGHLYPEDEEDEG